jgi:hypothetical protein
VTDAALDRAGKGHPCPTRRSSSEGRFVSPRRTRDSVEQARDRLAGLLPEDALQDALKGLEPEEITPGSARERRCEHRVGNERPARAPRDRSGAACDPWLERITLHECRHTYASFLWPPATR